MDVHEASHQVAADVVIVSCVAYALCFLAYGYVWKTRFFPPLRVKNPGLTVLANLAAFIWFISLLMTKYLSRYWPASPFTCWSWQLFGRFLGQSLYMTAIMAKQYRAFQQYAVGKSTYSAATHVLLGQIPFTVLLAIPVKLYIAEYHTCMNYDTADYISWGYQGVLAILCSIMVYHLRCSSTFYDYPNFGDSCLECCGMLLQTWLHGFSLMCPHAPLGLTDDSKQLFIAFANTTVIPVMIFFGVLGKPMWKYFKNDSAFTRAFDERFGSRITASATSLAGVYCLVGFNSQTHRSSYVREDYYEQNPEEAQTSFEVEELSRLVMSGELRLVKQFLYNSTLSIVNEKDSDGSTPLHRAVRNSHKDMIEFLLNMGANPDAVEKDGVTALHVAASLGNVECIYLLAGLNKGDVNAMTIAHGKAPLTIAVKSECMATICTLLNLGADPNLYAAKGETDELTDIRSYARKVGHYSRFKSPFFLAIELGLDRIANFMHSIHRAHGGVGAACESPGPQGMTPLCAASLLGHTRVVESLLTMGADTVSVNKRQRRSCLHYVCMKGSLKTFQVLLKSISRRILVEAEGIPQCEGRRWSLGSEEGPQPKPAPPDMALYPRLSINQSLEDSIGGHSDVFTVVSSETKSGGSTTSDESKAASYGDLHHEGLPRHYFDLLDLQDMCGRTALHYAVLKGSAQITYMLLCLGASTTLEDHPPSQDKARVGCAVPRSGLNCSPDCPTMGWTARRYAEELAKTHEPYIKVVAVFREAARLLDKKPNYPTEYLHDDVKWLPVT
mmetsp:Transcript_61893/g.110254  ORF Transcript_61893/g.110254 Transcript_61893/m.110254 type:complete len:784 (-) Transcript_61893:44-2395(-)